MGSGKKSSGGSSRGEFSVSQGRPNPFEQGRPDPFEQANLDLEKVNQDRSEVSIEEVNPIEQANLDLQDANEVIYQKTAEKFPDNGNSDFYSEGESSPRKPHKDFSRIDSPTNAHDMSDKSRKTKQGRQETQHRLVTSNGFSQKDMGPSKVMDTSPDRSKAHSYQGIKDKSMITISSNDRSERKVRNIANSFEDLNAKLDIHGHWSKPSLGPDDKEKSARTFQTISNPGLPPKSGQSIPSRRSLRQVQENTTHKSNSRRSRRSTDRVTSNRLESQPINILQAPEVHADGNSFNNSDYQSIADENSSQKSNRDA